MTSPTNNDFSNNNNNPIPTFAEQQTQSVWKFQTKESSRFDSVALGVSRFLHHVIGNTVTEPSKQSLFLKIGLSTAAVFNGILAIIEGIGRLLIGVITSPLLLHKGAGLIPELLGFVAAKQSFMQIPGMVKTIAQTWDQDRDGDINVEENVRKAHLALFPSAKGD